MSPRPYEYPLRIENRYITLSGSQLDSNLNLYIRDTKVYCLGYRFRDWSEEYWTKRINRFKRGSEICVNRFSRIFQENPPISPNILNGETLCMGIIKSSKTELEPDDSIYNLGQTVSNSLGIEWQPHLATKRVHQSLHGIYNGDERDNTVRGVYTVTPNTEVEYSNLILVDDICTRGSSFLDCIRAAKQSYPSLNKCFCIAVGKSENYHYLNDRGNEITNNHLPEELFRRE